MWKIFNKSSFCGNFPKKVNLLKTFKQSIFLRKLSNKANGYGNFSTRRIFMKLLQQSKFLGIFSTKRHTFCWKFCDKTGLISVEFFPTKNLKLGGNPATKLCEFLWKFLKNPNIHASMLPHCKSFCDSTLILSLLTLLVYVIPETQY